MIYNLHRNANGMTFSMGRFATLAEAVAAAPRSGEPQKTGTHEWAFLPEPTSKLILITCDKKEP